MIIETMMFSSLPPDYFAPSCIPLKELKQEDNKEDPNARQRELESAFCRDFLCCGQKLLDLHALLHHYEEHHLFLDDDEEEQEEYDTIPLMLMEWNNPNNNNKNNNEMILLDDRYPQQQQQLSVSPSLSPSQQQPPQQQPQIPPMTTIDPVNATFYQQEEYENGETSSQIPTPFDSRGSSPIDTTSVSSSEDLYTPPPSPPLKKRKFSMDWSSPYPNNTTTSDIELLLQQVNSADLFYNYEQEDASERPYKCQVDGCDKAYKNANGLKYHKAHGHCHEKQEDENELNAKKPYRCSIGICNKRYKNLNGLKYHIEHSHLAKLRRRQESIQNITAATVAATPVII
ncbi:hypothetical protein BDC45DRAFT_493755 [Circinella umbellata]|nr:hypothetical protein BDC45DRAFT_493755 [Circinella umbellata]